MLIVKLSPLISFDNGMSFVYPRLSLSLLFPPDERAETKDTVVSV